MEVIRVTRHDHMLGGGTSVNLHVANGETCYDFLTGIKAINGPVRVWHNNAPVGLQHLQQTSLRDGDTFNVVPVQKADPATVAAFASYIGTSAAVASVIINIGISLAVNFVISTVFGPSDRGFREVRKDPEGYGLTGGGNQARRFSPLPIVMGKHRIFPDYAAPWVVDYVTDPDVFRDVCNNTPTFETVTTPVFAFTPSPASKAWNLFTVAEQNPGAVWTASDTNPAWGADGGQYVYFFGQGQSCGIEHLLAYRWNAPALGQPWTAGTIEWTTYAEYYASINNCVGEGESGQVNCPSANWRTYSPGTSLEVISGYGYTAFETTQRLTNVFSYGFGDLLLTDHHIATTPSTSFKNVTVTLPVFTSNATSLLGWRRGPDTSVGPFIEYPTNCEAVEGGELKKGSGVAGDGWVTRESSRKNATFLEVDFAGRLFRNGGGGAETLEREFDCRYRLVGTSAWTTAPGFPVTFSNGDTTVFRETSRWAVPAGRYEVEVRRVSDDETDASNISDINLERVKFYVDDPITTYPAVNRVGVQVTASGQINGTLDRWSSLAEAKCWVYTAPTYDNTEPGASANWSWTTTQNPAWWLLYFAMGGFLNTSDPRGWKIGVHPTNGERLFGAGLPNTLIDFPTIHQFSKWCTSKNLKFSAVVDSQRPCADVMIDIAQAGRGSPNWSNDKFTVVWADPADIPVAQFGMGNIIAGSFNVGYNITRRTDEVVASFSDETDFYVSRQVRAVVPGVTNPINSTTIQFFGVTTEEQAQREVNLRAADIRYHIRSITFETSVEGMVPQRGDVIMLAHDMTAWGYSGRLRDISDDGLVLTLPRDLYDPAATGSYWVQIRLPDGTFVTQQVPAPSTPVSTITLTTALPEFPDHFPEDFLFQAGPSETPGKRCRVMSIEPTQQATVKIVATDDYPEYYLQETSVTGEEPEMDERLIARVYNPVVEHRVDGYWLCWEVQNCRGAQVSASVDGGTGSIIAGNLVVAGTELKLPTYGTGTVLELTLLPDDVVAAVASVGDTTTFTY